MTDAITVLTNDHQTVKGLFQKVQGASGPDESTVNEIVRELSIHDAIERQYLYPVVREKLAGRGEGLADHSIEEHNEVAQTLLAIDKAENGSSEQRQLLTQLIASVEGHVREEEQEIFPGLRQALSTTELNELGETLLTAKKTAPTRPHPMAPNEGVGTKIAGAMSAPIDRVRDAVEGRS